MNLGGLCIGIIAVLLLATVAHADQPRRQVHFQSADGRFVVVHLYRSIEPTPIFEEGRFVGLQDRPGSGQIAREFGRLATLLRGWVW